MLPQPFKKNLSFLGEGCGSKVFYYVTDVCADIDFTPHMTAGDIKARLSRYQLETMDPLLSRVRSGLGKEWLFLANTYIAIQDGLDSLSEGVKPKHTQFLKNLSSHGEVLSETFPMADWKKNWSRYLAIIQDILQNSDSINSLNLQTRMLGESRKFRAHLEKHILPALIGGK